MKQPQVHETGSQVPVPAQAQEIAGAFARIGKLSQGGKNNEAVAAARVLHAKYPNDPAANFIMALVLNDNRQSRDAIPFAEAAVKFAPDSARHLLFLGKLYVDQGLIEFAPEVLHKAFSLDKKLFQAPWALGGYYWAAGQGSRALPYYELAIQAAPAEREGFIRLDRAMCHSSMGNTTEAEADLEEAERDPKLRVEALAIRALLKKNDHTSRCAGELRKELERPDLDSGDRSLLLLSLGRLYENGREFDSAFLAFQKSRALLKSTFVPGNFGKRVNDAIKTMTPDVFGEYKKFGHDSRKPIFVVGMPRSGTTLTEQIIAAHSMAEGVGELQRMSNLFTRFSHPNGMQQVLDKMAEAGPGRWKDVSREYLNLLNFLAPDAKHAVDKLPMNFLCLGFIHLCFPNARIIHCTRNPLDNFISAFQNKMNSDHGYSYDQVDYGNHYLEYRQLMNHWAAVMPDSIYQSRYEELTENPEVEIRRILNFLGLPWEEACLKFNERKSTINTLSQLQVRNPVNTGSVSRWRNYEKHLGPIIGVFEKAGIPVLR